jgi:hypothetical protein
MAGGKLVDYPHHRSHAIHIDAGRFSAFEADQHPICAIDLKSNLAPAHQQLRADRERRRDVQSLTPSAPSIGY